nr:FAD binding domain-containing protein [uncultured Dongia sp.]
MNSLHVATSVADAIAALADRGDGGAPLAGATWIMRAPIRKEQHPRSYVALAKIDELQRVELLHDYLSIGACVTHARLAAALAPLPEFRALAVAAGSSANPAIRQMATIGGNLCAAGFAAADLVPALICLDAQIELAMPGESTRVSVEAFLTMRTDLPHGCLVRRVMVPRTTYRSDHVRLTLRKGGDYPVVIVSLAAELGSTGVVKSARVAIGSVETTARRWEKFERLLIGHPLDPADVTEKATLCADELHGREGVEAPGWYRIKVLPSLVGRAVRNIRGQC